MQNNPFEFAQTLCRGIDHPDMPDDTKATLILVVFGALELAAPDERPINRTVSPQNLRPATALILRSIAEQPEQIRKLAHATYNDAAAIDGHFGAMPTLSQFAGLAAGWVLRPRLLIDSFGSAMYFSAQEITARANEAMPGRPARIIVAGGFSATGQVHDALGAGPR